MTNHFITEAIKTQLTLMEALASDIHACIQTAEHDLKDHNLNTAIGGLLRTQEHLASLQTLYQSILTIHRNAHIIQQPQHFSGE